MSKLDQVLIIEPPTELKFKGPFTEIVMSELKLKNPSPRRVLFKVKTTAPKRYCVRPNSGIVEPGAQAVISVMLQPFDHDSTEKSKHKFMVQSMFAPEEPFENQDVLWKEVSPSQLMDSKLRCVFELVPADDAPDSSKQNLNITQESIVKPVYSKEIAPPAPQLPETVGSARVSTTPVKAGSVSETVDVRKLNEECQKLNADIQRLRAENEQLRTEGLRLRKVAMSDTVSSTPPLPTSPLPKIPDAASSGITVSYAAYLVAMVILGLLIGKLLL